MKVLCFWGDFQKQKNGGTISLQGTSPYANFWKRKIIESKSCFGNVSSQEGTYARWWVFPMVFFVFSYRNLGKMLFSVHPLRCICFFAQKELKLFLCIRHLSFGIPLVILFEIRIRLPPRGKTPLTCEKIFESIHAFYLDMFQKVCFFSITKKHSRTLRQTKILCTNVCLFCIILVPPRKYGISFDIQIESHIPLIYPPPRMLARHQPGW